MIQQVVRQKVLKALKAKGVKDYPSYGHLNQIALKATSMVWQWMGM